MKKSGFTLIEVLVAVTLMSIIVLFLINSSFNLQKGYDSLYKSESKSFSDYDRKELIYMDILEASQIDIDSNRKFDILTLKTKNSLYQRENCYVIYTVLQKGNKLIRLENDNNISLPVSQEEIYKTGFLIVKEDLEEFKILRNEEKKKQDLLMVYIKDKNQIPDLFEIGLINN